MDTPVALAWPPQLLDSRGPALLPAQCCVIWDCWLSSGGREDSVNGRYGSEVV